MNNFEHAQNFEPKDKKEYENKFPFSYQFPDGTVGRYETQEEMTEAIQEYKEGND